MNARKVRRSTILGFCLALTPCAVQGDDGGPATRFGAVGDEFQVNTYTTSDQGNPAVAVDADGDFVVVWQSVGSAGSDSLETSVQGQRYASDGSPLAGEFQVNTYTTSSQIYPAVAMDSDGDFVVVWWSVGSAGTDSSSTSVQGQRYASDGSAVGGEFQVNTYTPSAQALPAVAVDADGDFVVVWQSVGSAGSDTSNQSVQGQRYASDGSALGGEFQINTYTTSNQRSPAVAMNGAGHFVVVWRSYGSAGSDTSNFSIQGQRYASDGSAVGGEFQVNTYTSSGQESSAVAMADDGDFVVVWHSLGSVGSDSQARSIQGQLYASDGSAVGGEFQINTYTTSVQTSPAVSIDGEGDFVVVWDSIGSPGTDPDDSVQGQRYASDGTAIGGQFQVNTYTTSFEGGSPAVAATTAGELVVVWNNGGSPGTDSSYESVLGQRFAFEADLSITKDDGLTSATPGDTLVYTIVASNAGPTDATDVSVTDTFPMGLTCDWTSFAMGGASGNTLASSGDLGETLSLPVGSSVTYTVDCDTDPDLEALVVNTATISSPVTDPNLANNSATDLTAVPAGIFADGFESGDTLAWSSTVGGAR